jgi:hypothetical protein
MKTLDTDTKFTATRILGLFIVIYVLFFPIIIQINLIYSIWNTKTDSSFWNTKTDSSFDSKMIQSLPYVVLIPIMLLLFLNLTKYLLTFISYTEDDILIQILFSQRIIKFSEIDAITYTKKKNHIDYYYFISHKKQIFNLNTMLHGVNFSTKLIDFIQKTRGNELKVLHNSIYIRMSD